MNWEKCELLAQKISQLKREDRKNEPKDYHLFKRYDFVQTGNTVKLIYPVAEGSSSIKYYIIKYYCVPCLKKSKVPKKVWLSNQCCSVKWILELKQTWLICQPDADLKWILVYQDHLIKFLQLCPVMSKRAPEIASFYLCKNYW